MTTLAEFLLVQIAEDEEAFRNSFGEDDGPGTWRRWGLADCEAKRRIIADHDDQHSCASWELASAEPYVGCNVLRALALPYADHPEFDPNWALEATTRRESSA